MPAGQLGLVMWTVLAKVSAGQFLIYFDFYIIVFILVLMAVLMCAMARAELWQDLLSGQLQPLSTQTGGETKLRGGESQQERHLRMWQQLGRGALTRLNRLRRLSMMNW